MGKIGKRGRGEEGKRERYEGGRRVEERMVMGSRRLGTEDWRWRQERETSEGDPRVRSKRRTLEGRECKKWGSVVNFGII